MDHPWMLVAPALAFGGVGISLITSRARRAGWTFIFSSLSVFGTVAMAGLTAFPFLLPSSTHPSHSLTVWDASSSQLTLLIMLIATLIFVPIILAYTSWVYKVLAGKVTKVMIQQKDQEAY